VRLVFFLIFGLGLSAQTGENVVLIVNRNSETSRQIAEYYRVRRSIPIANVCTLSASTDEEITWDVYVKQVEEPVANCLRKAGLIEKALYLVTTLGVPLKVDGAGRGQMSEHSSVDSELTLLYGKLHGVKYSRVGWVSNPMFMRRDTAFRHPVVPIYAVTRLAGYDLNDVRAMVDRSLQARNRGRFVLDLQSEKFEPGNDWLRTAAMLLPAPRTTIETTTRVLYRQTDVIGYSSWGSNDDHRTERWLHFQWLPGAIASEFVSTSARTFKRPADDWKPTSWSDKAHYFEGSPQGLVADLIHEGATGASGNTYEPYLAACARPEYLLPAYYAGRNLADSFYIALPYLSWQSVILGDPLCSLGKPKLQR
jgi:uncharacterized protein (TIGR03790 family)